MDITTRFSGSNVARKVVRLGALLSSLLLLTTFVSTADALPIRYEYEGESVDGTVHHEGFMVFDDSLFVGGESFEPIAQSNFTDFGMTATVNGSTVFTWVLADATSSGGTWYFNSLDFVPPSVAGAGGDIARVSGTYLLAFSDTNITSTFGSTSGAWVVSTSPVPVPAAVWLFGSALFGLVGLGRKKKSS